MKQEPVPVFVPVFVKRHKRLDAYCHLYANLKVKREKLRMVDAFNNKDVKGV